MENKNGDICANCAAVYELHSYKDNLCPKNGKEAKWNGNQEWEEFSFLSMESEYDKLKKDNERYEKELKAMYSLNKEGWTKVQQYEKLYTKEKEDNALLIEALENILSWLREYETGYFFNEVSVIKAKELLTNLKK